MKKTLAITREDNTIFKHKRYFSTGGYQAPLAYSKEETFRIINDNKPDLIITEDYSSKFNGIEFLIRTAREQL